jgi:putative spermidine/putrescine transport system permease protein
MAQMTADQSLIVTVDGIPLKTKLAQAERRNKLRALGLVLPLLAFISISFIFPILQMIFRSVDNPVVAETLPRTLQALEDWDGNEVPGEDVFAILAEEMTTAAEARTIGKVATRLNYDLPGSRSVITGTARKIKKLEKGPYREAFIDAKDNWGEVEIWTKLKRVGEPYTLSYYLSALDMQYDAEGNISAQDPNRQIYVPLFIRTLWVSLLITVVCIVLAYPISYLMATLPSGRRFWSARPPGSSCCRPRACSTTSPSGSASSATRTACR